MVVHSSCRPAVPFWTLIGPLLVAYLDLDCHAVVAIALPLPLLHAALVYAPLLSDDAFPPPLLSLLCHFDLLHHT